MPLVLQYAVAIMSNNHVSVLQTYANASLIKKPTDFAEQVENQYTDTICGLMLQKLKELETRLKNEGPEGDQKEENRASSTGFEEENKYVQAAAVGFSETTPSHPSEDTKSEQGILKCKDHERAMG